MVGSGNPRTATPRSALPRRSRENTPNRGFNCPDPKPYDRFQVAAVPPTTAPPPFNLAQNGTSRTEIETAPDVLDAIRQFDTCTIANAIEGSASACGTKALRAPACVA